MKLLTIPEFLENKRHEALVIFGTGYSINWITKEQWEIIDRDYDTFGMNWYCKSKRPTTWYLIREQCTTPKRIEPGHLLDDFIELMGSFEKSIKIVKDMSYRLNNYQHSRNLENFDGSGYVFNEIPGGCSAKCFSRDDIFDIGIHHGKCTMYDALHFAIAMRYKKILFCGVDLYDNRYFYLPINETLRQTINDGNSVEAPHLAAEKTVKIIADAHALHPEITMVVHNSRSLLTKVIPWWENE